MKTLKTLFLFLALVCAGNSFGQTKEETIEWLKEKLNNSTETVFFDTKAGRSDFGTGFKVEDKVSFNIIDNQLIISFQEYDYYKIAHAIKVLVDLNKVTITSNTKSQEIFGVYLKSEDFLPVKVISNYSYIENGLRDSITIELKIEEDDLPQRIETALKHYISIMPKVEKKKETF